MVEYSMPDPKRKWYQDDLGMTKLPIFMAGFLLSILLVVAVILMFGMTGTRDMIACRKQGLDAVSLPFPSLHQTCVPRAGQGVDTIYVKQ